MTSLIRAAEHTGIQPIDDINSPTAPGAGYVRQDVTQDSKRRRHGTFHAFLPASLVRERKARLKICTNALATRLEFDLDESGGLRATGVHFEATDYIGLGPRSHLETMGIPVVREMPGIGNYLQDHAAVCLTFEVPMNDSLHQLEASRIKVIKELATYLISGGGLLSYPLQPITIYLPSKLLDNDANLSTADKQDLDSGDVANCADLEFMPEANNCTDHVIPCKGLFSFIIALIRPKSHGSVRLATSNPRARPEVDLGFLTNPEDMVPLKKGIKFGLRLAEDMRKQGYPLKNLIVPEDLDDSSLDNFIRQNLRTCYHYTSTCRMGAEADLLNPGVVDAELRVHGVQGLRVCDASVFPEIVGAHTMAPVVMVAEKCADLIKDTYRAGSM
ncbi:GMC oxidoreductase [Trametes cinnabarina]|uniref:GMC oxidoreductase n=1 Tax=Pycnoporus cinnabarinus TaxID=5643 RepID=A0A060S908_PYCCI|nr:GMC oxidoreductase [Trametes cinnabarina]